MRAAQLDNDIVGGNAILAQDGYGGVRRILGEIAAGPFIQQRLSRQVRCGSHGPVGKDNGSRLTPAKVSVWPRRPAPCALMTNSDGTISTLTEDLLGGEALVAVAGGAWAHANAGRESKAAIVASR
jgi:hypothetical protein